MILVTGGTGYLGRALVDQLLAQGERVRVLCRGRRVTPAEACIGDVTEPARLDAAMRGVEVVYHLAALVDHHAPEAALYRVNVQGTINVAEAALRHGVRRMVHCSSVSAEPGGGSTPYGRSKIAAEQALAAYRKRLPIITLRPGPVYDEERVNLRRLVRFAAATRLCPRLVPDVTVHLASRSNVTAAFLLARDRGEPGGVYAICDREPVERSSLARIIQRETGAIAVPLPLPLLSPVLHAAALACAGLHAALGLRPALDRRHLRVLTRARRYDIARACAELGFDPAPTERHFAEAVWRCLDRSAQGTVGGIQARP